MAERRRHLDRENILRALTKKIDAIEGGINLGQGVCDLDMPEALRDTSDSGMLLQERIDLLCEWIEQIRGIDWHSISAEEAANEIAETNPF